MNDVSSKASAVLLPPATVALHINDQSIREAAKELASDWRFARITFDIREGSIETAIQAYDGYASPELVIVETATIEAGFTDRLEQLASNCSANTSAVVIGPVNDVYLYRKMIDMGVSDYLVKPLSREMLAEVISKTLIEKFGAPESKLLAIIGAKGGVGASTVSEEVARSAANRLEEKTILLDAAGGWSYLPVSLGTEPMTNFTEMTRIAAATDEAAFKRMIYSPTDKLSILATGSDALLEDNLTADGYEMIINRLMIAYPLVIIDLSAASASVRKMVLSRAHNIVVVSTPSLPSLRSARALMMEIKNMRGDSGDNVDLVINKTGQAGNLEIAKADIEKALERKISLTLAYDEKLFAAAEVQGKALSDIKGGDIVSASITEFVRKILKAKAVSQSSAVKASEASVLGGFLSKITGKKG